ncbi:hypothetical protein AAC387_Pa05g0950 [Persea americana]
MAQKSDAYGYLDEAGYEVVVVGSGYGGSVAACRLAMAGIKACLIEKGRRWEAKDFPTNDLQIMSQIRMESATYGFSYGPKNGLFQAGCTVMTECEVQCIVEDVDDNYDDDGVIRKKQRRRWRIYFNDLEYVSADYVVLAGGVLGTTRILFQSERRGLKLSDRLGFGFSTNGNNFAYLAGSSEPLSGVGVAEKEFSKTAFQDRPGPTITSSLTSSAGFTVQSGVVPRGFPQLLLKGFFTFGWPINYRILNGVIDQLKEMMGTKPTHGMLLNLMGYDEANGRITLDEATDKIIFSPPQDPLLPRKMKAIQRITKRLGGILFMSRYRSTSVHLLGGCNVASDPSHGVCNPNGQVFKPQSDPQAVHRGLYVCDASLIPCPIGINPSLSIIAAAEHVSSHLVEDVLKYKSLNQPTEIPSKSQPRVDGKPMKLMRSPNEVLIKEMMTGQVGGLPCTVYLTMKMNSANQKPYNEGKGAKGGAHPILRGRVGGYCLFEFVQKDRLYIVDGSVNMCSIDCRTPYTQYMHYKLLLASASGKRYILEGNKIMNPYLLAFNTWNETRTLHVTFKEVAPSDDPAIEKCTEEPLNLTGEIQVSAIELFKSAVTLKGNQRGTFVYRLLESFFRTYILQTPRSSHLDFSPYDMSQRPYPSNILHEIKTDDGFVITCKQWIPEGEKKTYPVLLINGYSTESFWLPTEPRDLVRTLLDEGYETWLLQTRLHPFHPSSNFTIEDIGKFDIPSALKKIRESHGPSAKVHVIAHCVGGVAFHMAILGGHIYASSLASLSCTNSSMFYRVTAHELLKMRLPIIPVLTALLGKKKILPIFNNLEALPQHQFVKSIARQIPHYERCSLEECEVFAGLFGNTFWHQNISPTMHHWLHKQTLRQVPLAPLPHLRKICLAGHAVNANGENTYLIHPERMALSTLYISGGRSILVTPETSLLANQYMNLHQPSFQHKRVVSEGFGHSDLLIGEESYKKVFPHIISHMKSAEQGGGITMDMEKGSTGNGMLLKATSDHGNGGFGAIVPLIILSIFAVFVGYFLVGMDMK